MTFPRTLLSVTFFRIGLAGVVLALVSVRRDMIYSLAWSLVGASGEAALIAAESVFSTWLFTA